MSAVAQAKLSVTQNFLKDPRLVARLLERCLIGAEDAVFEIGAGEGIITAELARRCRRVIAIEKDASLCWLLRKRFEGMENVSIYCGDFLEFPLPRGPYKIFANIPFNITSAIVSRLTERANPPEESYLVVQREAARMNSGVPRECLRSVLLKPWFRLEIVHEFRRCDFRPQPHVDCVLLGIHKRSPPLVAKEDRQLFRDFVVFGFCGWKPALGEILKQVFSYRQLKQIRREYGFDLEATPGMLVFEDWLRLFGRFKEVGSRGAVGMVRGSESRLRMQQEKLEKVHRTRVR